MFALGEGLPTRTVLDGITITEEERKGIEMSPEERKHGKYGESG